MYAMGDTSGYDLVAQWIDFVSLLWPTPVVQVSCVVGVG